MARLNTLLLDGSAWDLVIDSSANIAMAAPPYSLAQDVASAARLFLGELWFDTTKGVPYFENVLGQLPPVSLLVSYLENAALSVPGVVTAQVIISSLNNREATGQIKFIDEAGVENNVNF